MRSLKMGMKSSTVTGTTCGHHSKIHYQVFWKPELWQLQGLEAIYLGYIKYFFQLLIIATTQKNH